MSSTPLSWTLSPSSSANVDPAGPSQRVVVRQALARGELVASRFRIQSVLGRGSMGTVYEALDQQNGEQRVALKVLHPHLGGLREAQRRFRREARALMRVRSERVARLRDFGKQDDGLLYLAMEHVAGHDLTCEVEQRGVLDWPRAQRVMVQLCEGLSAVHEAGLVHRDLKPRNVLVSESSDGPQVKLVDFGLCKTGKADQRAARALTPITAEGTTVGSLLYMSPEQAVGRVNVDARADVFSLGCIFYFLLVGRPPFSQRTIAHAGRTQLELTFPALSYYRSDLPPYIEEVLRVALATRPEQRFRSVGALRRALLDHDSQPVASALRSRWDNPWLIVLGSALLTATLCLLFYFLLLA